MHKWIFIVGATCAFAACALADEPAATATNLSPQAEQQIREELRLLVARLAATGALGAHPDQVAVTLDEPAQRVNDLGLLVDSTNAERSRDGLRILGTTPGGIGERLGIHAGDMLVSINGTMLRSLGADNNGHALAARTLKSVVEALPDNALLQVEVLRAGSTLTLQAPVQSLRLPALHLQLGASAASASATPTAPVAAETGGCGRISTFDVAPRSSQLYRARILMLDGSTPGVGDQQSYRVSAGKHQLIVAEDIPSDQMGVGSMAQLRRNTQKPLEIDVKPGTTMLIAALLHRDRATELANGAFWDPVVWKTSNEHCPQR